MPNYTILLVDYEPRSIERSRRPLVDAGFRVVLASDGIAALEAFEQLKPDLVLMEAMLPKKHGFEVCQQLKQTPEGKRTPILITTAVYKGRKYRSQALHVHGCDEYIEKPIADDQLIALVSLFLEASPKNPGAVPPEVEEAPVAAPAPSRPTPAAPEGPALVRSTPAMTGTTSGAGAAAGSPPSAGGETPWRAGTAPFGGGLTEGEILARLDEILPPDVWSTAAGAQAAEPAPAVAVAVADVPSEEIFNLEAATHSLADTEPEIEIIDEPAAVAEEGLVPVVAPEATDLPAPAVAPTEHQPTEPGVVRFDAGRAKKRKKSRNRGETTADAPSEPTSSPAPVAASIPLVVPAPAPAAAAVRDARPHPALAEAPARRGIPFWVWLLIVAVVAAGIYLAFFRDGSSVAASPTTAAPVANGPPSPDVVAPPSASLPAEAPAITPPSPTPATPEPAAASRGSQPPAPPSRAAVGRSSAAASPARTPGPRTAPASAPVSVLAVVSAPQATAAGTEIVRAVEPDTAIAPPQAEIAVDAAGLGIEAVPVQIVSPSATTARRSIQQGDLLPLREADRPPVALTRTPPEYPWRARLAGRNGVVDLNLLVDDQGRVLDVTVVQAPTPDLGEVAARAARGWTYKPAMKDGVSVKVWKPEQVVFKR